jgi:hypothetical protein
VAHIELNAALEKMREDSGRWNISLAMLRRQQEDSTEELSPPSKKNGLNAQASKPLM